MTKIRLLVIVGLLALVAACGSQQPVSFSDARAKASNDVHEAIAGAFPSGTYLEETLVSNLNCTDSFNRPTGEVMASVRFWVNVLDTSKNNAQFDKLKGWWAEHHWSVKNDSWPGDMFMNATRDDYLMSVEVGAGDRISIGESAPCMKGNGQ